MSVIRQFYALFLLLCFLRTLLPEAWVLALHSHEHTWEEPAQGLVRKQPAKALLTVKHQHCQTDHFCTTPFQLPPPLELAAVLREYQRVTTVALLCAGKLAPPAVEYLRGPPARS